MTLEPRPGVMNVQPYVPGRSDASGAKRVFKLSSNESPFGPSPKAIAAYESAEPALGVYPEGTSRILREAIAAHYGLSAERIICGNGSDEILHLIADTYLRPGDEVLARVSPSTRMVFVANPNNPTGTYLSVSEMQRLQSGLPDSSLLVIDAAYAEYVGKSDYNAGIKLVDDSENVIMTRTFSKAYGLAGIRIGWGYCPQAIADVLNRVRQPSNVNVAAQRAAVAALADSAYVERVIRHNEIWRARLIDEIRKFSNKGVRVDDSAGNFVLLHFADAK